LPVKDRRPEGLAPLAAFTFSGFSYGKSKLSIRRKEIINSCNYQKRVTFNEIQATVAQARLEYQASEAGDAKDQDKAVHVHLKAMSAAIKEAATWKEDVQRKIEQIPTGRGNVTHPKHDDPYWRLYQKAAPFIINLEKERDNLETWLEQRQN
jgi:hypothetical protein